MLITKLEKQKKNNKRYNLYIAGEFYCGLYDDTILKFGIASGDELTENRLTEIREFDEYIYGKKISFDYLSYRIRTAAEIKKKLKSKDISPAITDKVIHHLNELGLINDEEFAKQLITEKIKNKPAGRRLLQQKLFEKGISKQVSETAIEKYLTDEDEKKMALKIYSKLKPKLKGLEKQKAKQKIYETLARKGFEYDIINEIIREKAE
ncbi:MAG TPA: RecX family transcriptional regulator [Ignavibacteria bacterium]|nr:RecX family transcriptional regulator [Ignavibacteria bacterium]